MVLSRAQGAAALDHIPFQVFDLQNDSPLALSIKNTEGITDIHAFMSQTATDLDGLKYTVPDVPDEDQVKEVPRWQRRMVSVFFDYVLCGQYTQDPINDS